MSSHPLKLSFWRIREGSSGNYTTEMALNMITKNFFRDHLLDNLGLNESAVKGRSEISGVHFHNVGIFISKMKVITSICKIK